MGTIFTCPHCDAVYFINWNGQPEMANHEEEAPASSELSSEFASDYSKIVPAIEQGYTPEEITEQPADQNFQSEQTYSADQGYNPNQFGSESGYSNESGAYGQNQEGEQPPVNDFGYQPEATMDNSVDYSASGGEAVAGEEPFDFSQTLDYVESAPPVTVSDDANFADVVEFANANVGAGPLAYTVFIEGIESSHLVYQLREAMTDSKFGWDVNELLTHIGGGRLTLKGLTPAKASVLINRIKYLPFKITWRQDVLSGS